MVAIDRKLNGSKGNINDEALTIANALIQNRTEEEWKEMGESRVRRNNPKMPYHLGRGARNLTNLVLARLVYIHV